MKSIKRVGLAASLVSFVACTSACGGGGDKSAADIAFVLVGKTGASPSEIRHQGEIPVDLFTAVELYSDDLRAYLAELGCTSMFVGDKYTLRALALGSMMAGVPEDIVITAEDVEKTLAAAAEDSDVRTALLGDVDLAEFGAILEMRGGRKSSVSGPSYTTSPDAPAFGTTVGSSGSDLRGTFALSVPGAKAPVWQKRIDAFAEFPETAETYGGPVYGSVDVVAALRRAGFEAALRQAHVCSERGGAMQLGS